MLSLEWLLSNTGVVKDVIVSVLSEETAEDIDKMKKVIKEGIDIAYDILREPSQAAGYEFDLTRDLSSKAEKTKMRLEKIQDK